MSEPASPNISPADTIFEIGLVMAGAISAGAYTAGVADFLIEALDEWDKFNKEKGRWVHEVKLRVISGASAGGMTGSILTAAFGGDFPPIHERPKPGEVSANPLYRAWVQQIDIRDLLESKDLEAQREIRKLRDMRRKGGLTGEEFENKVSDLGHPLVSLLDSTKLRKIAEEAVLVTPKKEPLSKRRPYLPDPFQLYLSIANLRGVPYLLKLEGGAQRMITHADFMHFALTANKPPDLKDDRLAGDEYMAWNEPYSTTPTYAFWLNPDKYETKNWKRLSDAALATGAFPFGLAPIKLNRLWEEYNKRKFPVSTYENGSYGLVFQTLDPEPIGTLQNSAYDFICVDGGLLDNSPFDLAHRVLTGDPNKGLERDTGLSKRGVILIAPFPDSKEPAGYQEPGGFLGLGNAILNSLMTQVRFNPEELILAADPNVGSRYLISPSRSDPPYSKEGHPGGTLQGDIACGPLGGFGGFLSEDFRHHDFMLGRRNCQWFLKTYFTLPEDNTLFQNWDKDLRKDFYVPPRETQDKSLKYLPIIPCAGNARPEILQPDWPSYSTGNLDELLGRIESRYLSFGKLLIDFYAKGALIKSFLRLGLRSQKGKVRRLLRANIETSLRDYGTRWDDTGAKSWRSRIWLILAVLAVGAGAIALLLYIGF